MSTITCPLPDCNEPDFTFDDLAEFHGHVVLGHGLDMRDNEFINFLIAALWERMISK